MKGEYADERDTINTNTTPTATTISTHLPTSTANMFSKFQQQKFQAHPHHSTHPQYQHPASHQHLFYLAKDPQTSEEADSCTAAAAAVKTTPTPTATNTPPKKPKTSTTTTTNEDGETIEVVRRPRGRPPGSKNKPKPPVVITREPDPGMSPYILEIPSGADIIESLTRVTRCRSFGLCVLTASGSVANVSLRQPGGGTLTFHGRFEMLSLSAVLLAVAVGNLSTLGSGGVGNGSNVNGVFTISLAGSQGQVVGGKVVGPLVAAGTVYVVAASFNNPTYHRLPVEGGEDSGTVGGNERQISSSPGVSGGGGGGGSGGDGGAVGVGGSGIYTSCHLGSDVIWAPTARPHHHPPPPPY